MNQSASDARWMSLALNLSKRGLGQTWPNPSVGCVIVKDGILLGQGWTQKGGRPHAETMALAQAGNVEGATAYVTLEPCSHHGKTPPCAQALIHAKLSRVVRALEDPDPRVSGNGHQMLSNAGIKVETGLMAEQAKQINAGFLKRVTQGLPFVTLKLASSFDGRIATSSGHSQWITGPEARAQGHKLRAQHDAIMVGSGTVLADDPDLRVRLKGLEGSSPVRVIMDTKARLPKTAKMLKTASEFPIWQCHGIAAKPTLNEVDAISVNATPEGLDPRDALEKLAQRGITRVYCEGGGTLAASLLKDGLVDQLVTFHAGLGIGADGTAALGLMAVDQLSEAKRFKLVDLTQMGNDIMATWRL